MRSNGHLEALRITGKADLFIILESGSEDSRITMGEVRAEDVIPDDFCLMLWPRCEK